jgi:hypothetical protein
MAKAIATVYDPPEPGEPYVAVIMMKGSVIFAQATPSVEEGETLLRHMLVGMADLAKAQGYT